MRTRILPAAGLLLAMALALSACAPAEPLQSMSKTNDEPGGTVPLTPVPSTPVTATPAPAAATPPASQPEPFPPDAVDFPDPAAYTWAPVLEGLNRPVNLGIAADGSGRLFIIEQAGLVRVLFNGELLPAPFLDIRASVGSSGNEQGLLGIAFHPDYADNGLFFVNYTARDGATTISRFQVDVAMAPESQAADPASEQVILRIPQPQANHNGGHLLFGPDGMLYIGMGDGGGAGDPNRNAQNLQSPLGKLLRIDVDSAQPYAIPPGNPFTVGGGLPEIWAYGLRNPWGIAFDPQTGGLFIADVGQNAWEEIDHLPAGFGGVPANFGWDLLEGEQPYRQDGFPLPADLVPPAFVYGHDQGCSVTGGQVYRGRELPAFTGVYLFGDFCSGTVWGLLPDGSGGWRGQVLFQTPHRISSIASGAQGELYLLDIRGGLYRLVDR